MTNPIIDDEGNKRWLDETRCYHREDGPAVIRATGTKWWYRHGKVHRDQGPAIEYNNGTKVWYQQGLCHRLDGPACEYQNGDKYWYYKGIRFEVKCQQKFEQLLRLKAFL